MAARKRASFGIAAVATALFFGAMGCDEGGLIIVDSTKPKTGAPSTEFVTGGNVAKNGKYTVVYTMGQPSPQGHTTGSEKTLNGGIVGATQPK